MKIIIEVVGSVMRVEIDGEEIHERSSISDKACSKAVPQDGPSPAGTGSELLAGREDRQEGEAVSADLPTIQESPRKAAEAVPERTALVGAAIASAVDEVEGQPSLISSKSGAIPDANVSGSERADVTDRRDDQSISKPAFNLRPNCKNPGDSCGGYGTKHCHSCLTAPAELEEA